MSASSATSCTSMSNFSLWCPAYLSVRRGFSSRFTLMQRLRFPTSLYPGIPRHSTTHFDLIVSGGHVAVAVADKVFLAVIIADDVAVFSDANAYANDVTTNSDADANAIPDAMAVQHPDAHSFAVTNSDYTRHSLQ